MELNKAIISNVCLIKGNNPRPYYDGKVKAKILVAHPNCKGEKGDSINSKAIFSAEIIELPEGAETGVHSHENREEIYFVLEGRGEVTVEKSKGVLNQGDVIWFPANNLHGIYNPNKENLKIFVVTAVTRPGMMIHD